MIRYSANTDHQRVENINVQNTPLFVKRNFMRRNHRGKWCYKSVYEAGKGITITEKNGSSPSYGRRRTEIMYAISHYEEYPRKRYERIKGREKLNFVWHAAISKNVSEHAYPSINL